MGSISNSLSSLVNPVTISNNSNSSSSSSSSSTNSTGIFTGTSAYSQDFQNVINRAAAIASLPITLFDEPTDEPDQSVERIEHDRHSDHQPPDGGAGHRYGHERIVLSGGLFESECRQRDTCR